MPEIFIFRKTISLNKILVFVFTFLNLRFGRSPRTRSHIPTLSKRRSQLSLVSVRWCLAYVSVSSTMCEYSNVIVLKTTKNYPKSLFSVKLALLYKTYFDTFEFSNKKMKALCNQMLYKLCTVKCVYHCIFYYATIAYHVGLNAVLGLPHPGPMS